LAKYSLGMDHIDRNNFGTIIKQQRLMAPLTLRELSEKSGVSSAYLSRIERGKRFPSAHILSKIAKPLGFNDDELFRLAGFLSHHSPTIDESRLAYGSRRLDPYVTSVLAQEPVEVQYAVIEILSILRSLTKSGREE